MSALPPGVFEIPYPPEVVGVLNGIMPTFEIVTPHLWVLATYGRTQTIKDYHMIVWKWYPFTHQTARIRLKMEVFRRGFLHRADHYLWLTSFSIDGERPPLYTQIVLDLSEPSTYPNPFELSIAVG